MCTSWLCIGLDPDMGRLPSGVPATVDGIVDFCRAIIDATADLTVCYKINFAFFELLGSAGWSAIEQVRRAVPDDIPVIADAKRGDIGNTSRAYAEAILRVLDFDAVTVNPYLGQDSITPFLQYPDKAMLVLCRTSNPGAADLQELEIGKSPLYLIVARQALALSGPGEVGLVVGATAPAALRAARDLSQDIILLVPGVGAQGGKAADAVRAAANQKGQNALITVSRDVLYASPLADFAAAARNVAHERRAETWLVDEELHADR
jgi:orotidine-5'-phosphate decarboxylase